MAETLPDQVTPIRPEPPCALCQDATARKMAAYALASMSCHVHTGDNQKACLALIVPLEGDDKNADPVDVVKNIMLLDGNGNSIDATAELLTSIIEEAASRALEESNEAAEKAA